MNKRSLIIVMTVVFLAFTTMAHAASNYLFEGMTKKLFRGVVNTLTGWIELPAQTVNGFNRGFKGNENNKVLGTVCGFFNGIWYSAGRTLSGAADIVTFWAANPEDNVDIGIPLRAKYAWDKEEPYGIFDPNFTDATMTPVGKKLLRGAGNSLFGFLELPGQILKGVSEGAYDLGIVRGLWYWYSRQASGLADIGTLLVPTPEENMGMPFEEKWPWGACAESIR